MKKAGVRSRANSNLVVRNANRAMRSWKGYGASTPGQLPTTHRFEPPAGRTHVDVLFEAHKIRVERGDYNIAEKHLADAIEALVAQRQATLSPDRPPRNPY